MIENYLDVLTRELDFDRSLSRCVRQEVADHLWEAVAADRSGDSFEAERQAVANFGDARAIAAEFAVVSLARHSRRAGIAALLVIVSVFVAMKARVAWYAAMQLAISDDFRAAGSLVITIDRYAFLSSVVIGLGGWIYIQSRRIPTAFDPAYRRQLRRFFLLCGAAAAALAVSVISDAVLTALQLSGTGLSAELLVPILSMAIELVCVGILISRIRGVALRAASTAALTQT
jgi:hypothetical protein